MVPLIWVKFGAEKPQRTNCARLRFVASSKSTRAAFCEFLTRTIGHNSQRISGCLSQFKGGRLPGCSICDTTPVTSDMAMKIASRQRRCQKTPIAVSQKTFLKRGGRRNAIDSFVESTNLCHQRPEFPVLKSCLEKEVVFCRSEQTVENFGEQVTNAPKSSRERRNTYRTETIFTHFLGHASIRHAPLNRFQHRETLKIG